MTMSAIAVIDRRPEHRLRVVLEQDAGDRGRDRGDHDEPGVAGCVIHDPPIREQRDPSEEQSLPLGPEVPAERDEGADVQR